MKHIGISLLLVGIIFFSACKQQEKKTVPNPVETVSAVDSVVIDNEMVKRLFPSEKNIFTGGDGAISIIIDKDKSYFLWGDSFMGEVKDNKRDTLTPLVMGNVWLLVDGEKVTTICKGTPEKPRSLLETGKIDNYPAILWPMHGFVKDSIVHVFMSTIVKTGSGTWDFYWHSSVYFRLKYPELTVIDKQEMKESQMNQVHYGFGFLEHEGYYYAYGTKPEKDMTAPLHIARAKLIENKLQQWEFFNGETWTADPMKTQALKGIDIPVSEQFSVFKHDNKFILLTQDRFIPDICTFIADKPEGNWYNKKKIYTEPEGKDERVFTYNAMAHPQYDENGKLLVSYCVNAKNIPDLFNDASIYRPRFIRVPYDLILK